LQQAEKIYPEGAQHGKSDRDLTELPWHLHDGAVTLP
jgi:hypothetical protein